jgi:hypothetical protein
VTISLPEAALPPEKPPEALQRVAFVLDHVSVTGLPATTVEGEAEKETVTLGWPSLLPPQADRHEKSEIIERLRSLVSTITVLLRLRHVIRR